MTERLHFLDVARAVLLLLGIPYHAAQPFSARGWFIHSGSYSRAAELAGEFSHQFRMHAFFLVAGFFAALLLSKRDPAIWLANRARRLLIPFLTMLALVLPAQAMILGAFETGDATHGLARMTREPRLWVAHSWFLRDLFIYCALLALMWRSVAQRRWAPRGWPWAIGLLAGFTLWKLLLNLLMGSALRHANSTLVYDAATFLTYLPFFALGVVICVTPRMLGIVTRYSGLGVAGALVWLVLTTILIDRDDFGFGPAALINALNGLIGSWLLIALARQFLDRPSPLVDYFVRAALIYYIVHLAFVFLFTGLLRGRGFATTIEWLLVTTLTLAACAIAYELIRRMSPIFFLFNGQAPRARPPAPTIVARHSTQD